MTSIILLTGYEGEIRTKHERFIWVNGLFWKTSVLL